MTNRSANHIQGIWLDTHPTNKATASLRFRVAFTWPSFDYNVPLYLEGKLISREQLDKMRSENGDDASLGFLWEDHNNFYFTKGYPTKHFATFNFIRADKSIEDVNWYTPHKTHQDDRMSWRFEPHWDHPFVREAEIAVKAPLEIAVRSNAFEVWLDNSLQDLYKTWDEDEETELGHEEHRSSWEMDERYGWDTPLFGPSASDIIPKHAFVPILEVKS